MPKVINLVGNKYGRLTVIDKPPVRGNKRDYRWFCICECGTEKLILGSHLRHGNVKSCGCYKIDFPSNSKHGHAKHGAVTKTYMTWQLMHRRCAGYTPVHKERYTDRGISVCARWDDFDVFLADMGERPDGKTIDRINPDGNYEPSNCRWADKFQQRHNRSTTKETA